MPIQTFRYKPKNTFWVTVEITVEYLCTEKPSILHQRIYGLTQFGFIVCYQDKIQAFIHKSRMISCEHYECKKAIQLELEIKYSVSSEIGLGIGIGNIGTGAFGFPTRAVEEVKNFQTECECCDQEIQDKRKIQSLLQVHDYGSEQKSSIALVLALSAISIATGFALKNFDKPGYFAEIFIGSMLLGVVVSGVIVFRRLSKLINSGSKVK